jgi:hypothetical protein
MRSMRSGSRNEASSRRKAAKCNAKLPQLAGATRVLHFHQA